MPVRLVGLKKTEPVPSVPSALMGKTHQRFLETSLLLLSETYSLVSSKEVRMPFGWFKALLTRVTEPSGLRIYTPW